MSVSIMPSWPSSPQPPSSLLPPDHQSQTHRPPENETQAALCKLIRGSSNGYVLVTKKIVEMLRYSSKAELVDFVERQQCSQSPQSQSSYQQEEEWAAQCHIEVRRYRHVMTQANKQNKKSGAGTGTAGKQKEQEKIYFVERRRNQSRQQQRPQQEESLGSLNQTNRKNKDKKAARKVGGGKRQTQPLSRTRQPKQQLQLNHSELQARHNQLEVTRQLLLLQRTIELEEHTSRLQIMFEEREFFLVAGMNSSLVICESRRQQQEAAAQQQKLPPTRHDDGKDGLGVRALLPFQGADNASADMTVEQRNVSDVADCVGVGAARNGGGSRSWFRADEIWKKFEGERFPRHPDGLSVAERIELEAFVEEVVSFGGKSPSSSSNCDSDSDSTSCSSGSYCHSSSSSTSCTTCTKEWNTFLGFFPTTWCASNGSVGSSSSDNASTSGNDFRSAADVPPSPSEDDNGECPSPFLTPLSVVTPPLFSSVKRKRFDEEDENEEGCNKADNKLVTDGEQDEENVAVPLFSSSSSDNLITPTSTRWQQHFGGGNRFGDSISNELDEDNGRSGPQGSVSCWGSPPNNTASTVEQRRQRRSTRHIPYSSPPSQQQQHSASPPSAAHCDGDVYPSPSTSTKVIRRSTSSVAATLSLATAAATATTPTTPSTSQHKQKQKQNSNKQFSGPLLLPSRMTFSMDSRPSTRRRSHFTPY